MYYIDIKEQTSMTSFSCYDTGHTVTKLVIIGWRMALTSIGKLLFCLPRTISQETD